jgi:hypothetical protein
MPADMPGGNPGGKNENTGEMIRTLNHAHVLTSLIAYDPERDKH